METDSIHVGGFEFLDSEYAKKASGELEAVEYIKGQMNWDDPDRVLELYNKILRSRMFVTPVGRSFLYDMRLRLLSSGKVDPLVVEDIPIARFSPLEEDHSTEEDSENNHRIKFYRAKIKKLNNSLSLLRWITAILIAIIIGMFCISLTGTAPTILNYRTKIQNEYSKWEKNLREREDIVRKKENELGIDNSEVKSDGTGQNTGS